jgi:hypothetical protein
MVRCVLGGAAMLATAVFLLCRHFGSASLAAAWLDGQTFVVSPTEVDLGECDPKSYHDVTFTVANVSGREIRIVGSDASCACLKVDKLPITIAPGERRGISLRAYVSGEDEYSQNLIIRLDDGELETAGVHIRARVRQAKPVLERRLSCEDGSLNGKVRIPIFRRAGVCGVGSFSQT